MIKTSGSVDIWGNDIVTARRQASSAIGIVPQEITVDPFFTPRETLELQAGYYGVPASERHTLEILVALGFVFGARVARNKAARDGFDPELINQVVGWIVAGVFIGGHLGHLLFYYPQDMANDPAKFLAMFQTLASGSLPAADDLPELLKVWRGLSKRPTGD